MNKKELLDKIARKETSFLEYLLMGDESDRFCNWCAERNVDANEDSAEFYFDMTYHPELDDSVVLIEEYAD